LDLIYRLVERPATDALLADSEELLVAEQVRQRMRVSPYARAFLFLLTELDIAPERTP
jgi:hypothetical protein